MEYRTRSSTTVETTEVQQRASSDPHTITPYVIKYAAIIDAGSSQPPPNQKPDEEDAPTRIADQLNQHFQGSNEQHLHVLVTHPDEDHINLIQSILEKIPLEDLTDISFYLGSTKANWGIDPNTRVRKLGKNQIPTKPKDVTTAVWTLIEYIEGLQRRHNARVIYGDDQPPPPMVAAAASSAAAPTPPTHLAPGTVIPLGPSVKLEILANTLLGPSSTTDTNDHSLVTLVDAGPLAFFVPGDATSTTLTSMGGKDGLQELLAGKKIIAVASHHGSQLRCNTEGWVNAIRASHVVCTTAASDEGMKHPDARVLAWYSRYALQASSHPLTTYINLLEREVPINDQIIAGLTAMVEQLFTRWSRPPLQVSAAGPSQSINPVHFDALVPLRQLIMRTRVIMSKAIYSTADSGNIAFTWQNGASTFDVKFFPPHDDESTDSDGDSESSGSGSGGADEDEDEDDDGGKKSSPRISLRDFVMHPSLPPLNLRTSGQSSGSQNTIPVGSLGSSLSVARTEASLQRPPTPPPSLHPRRMPPHFLPPLRATVAGSLSLTRQDQPSPSWFSDFSSRYVTEGDQEERAVPSLGSSRRRYLAYRSSLSTVQQAPPPHPPRRLPPLVQPSSPSSFIGLPDPTPPSSGEEDASNDAMEDDGQ